MLILVLLVTAAIAANAEKDPFPTFDNFPINAINSEPREKRQPHDTGYPHQHKRHDTGYPPQHERSVAPPSPYSAAAYAPAPVYHEPAPARRRDGPAT